MSPFSSPQRQVGWTLAAFFVIALSLVAIAYIALTGSTTANDAQATADVGRAACNRQVATYHDGIRVRHAVQDGFRNSRAYWLTEQKQWEEIAALAKPSDKPNPVLAKILQLALNDAHAAERAAALANRITFPGPPTCNKQR